MNNEQTKEALKEELELLRKENEQLKRQLRSLEQNKQPEESSTSFQERYAVKILNSLPDMLTVFNHDEVGMKKPIMSGYPTKILKECTCARWCLPKPIRTSMPICRK